MSESVFKERGWGGILGELFAIYRRNFLHFIGLVAAAAMPLLVFGSRLIWYAFSFLLLGPGKFIIIAILIGFLTATAFMATALVPAASLYSVAGHYLGQRPRIGRAYQFAQRRVRSLWGVAFLALLAEFAAGLTLVGPPGFIAGMIIMTILAALYLGLAWPFTIQVLVMEGCSAGKLTSRLSF